MWSIFPGRPNIKSLFGVFFWLLLPRDNKIGPFLQLFLEEFSERVLTAFFIASLTRLFNIFSFSPTKSTSTGSKSVSGESAIILMLIPLRIYTSLPSTSFISIILKVISLSYDFLTTVSPITIFSPNNYIITVYSMFFY